MKKKELLNTALIISTREKMGLSQQVLADYCGMCRTTLSRLENNKGTPRIQHLISWSRETGVKIDEIIKE